MSETTYQAWRYRHVMRSRAVDGWDGSRWTEIEPNWYADELPDELEGVPHGEDVPRDDDLFTDVDGEGTVYVSHDSCYVCDYGGAGSVGAANIRWLQQNRAGDVWVRYGAYDSAQAFLPDTPENRELLEGLDDYPLFDDETRSQVESEWEEEAWDNWLRSDLYGELPDVLQHWVDSREDSGVLLWECYCSAMEDTNTYPESEHSGVSVDVERIADTFRGLVSDLAFADADWIAERLTTLHEDHGCPVLETDDTSLMVLLDWCEEYNYSDEWTDILSTRMDRAAD